MTVLFLLALASLELLMKLVALRAPGASDKTNLAFVLSPLVSPESLKRSPPWSIGPKLFFRALLLLGAVFLCYRMYWILVRTLNISGILLSYLAAPALLAIGELFGASATLLWLPSGRLLPPLHHNPPLARGVAEFWGRRWNLWFSDWFRDAIFARLPGRPVFALFLVFFVSGLMHEWVINFPLYLVAGKKYFGSMMLYFLLQAAGVVMERRFLRKNAVAKIVFTWLIVLGPAPLIINEGLLRALHLWPAWSKSLFP